MISGICEKIAPIQERFHGKRIYTVNQVHGTALSLVDLKGPSLKEADAIATTRKDIVIAVKSADCVPIILWDDDEQVIAVIHSGWKGTAANITGKVLTELCNRFGVVPAKFNALIGPSIMKCCYQVGREVFDKMDDKRFFTHDLKGKWLLDLNSMVVDQLISGRVAAGKIRTSGICTMCSPQKLPSFRRDGDKADRLYSWATLGN